MPVPGDFQFTFKVTDDITLKRFPKLPRFGTRAEQPNQHFLDADLFRRAFLAPCETVRPMVGLLRESNLLLVDSPRYKLPP